MIIGRGSDMGIERSRDLTGRQMPSDALGCCRSRVGRGASDVSAYTALPSSFDALMSRALYSFATNEYRFVLIHGAVE
jgi:hypothetical protein